MEQNPDAIVRKKDNEDRRKTKRSQTTVDYKTHAGFLFADRDVNQSRTAQSSDGELNLH